MNWSETSAVLAGGIVMIILRLGNIFVQWTARKLGVEEKPSLFNDPTLATTKPAEP